jgi:spoIIIJ-associated protein
MTEQNLSTEAGQDSEQAKGASGPLAVSGDLAEEGASAAADRDAEVLRAQDSDDSQDDFAEDVAEGGADGPSDDLAEGAGRTSNRRAQLEREGEVAADFLETLLDIADLDGDIDVDIEGDRAAVAIVDSEDGRVPRRLVGQDGRVLEALQELTRLAVQSATGERSRLMLDIAGHRAERRSALVEVARTAIARVKDSGESQSLSPMSAFERKVIHDEVLAAGLVSESDGVEPRRFVVIHPA